MNDVSSTLQYEILSYIDFSQWNKIHSSGSNMLYTCDQSNFIKECDKFLIDIASNYVDYTTLIYHYWKPSHYKQRTSYCNVSAECFSYINSTCKKEVEQINKLSIKLFDVDICFSLYHGEKYYNIVHPISCKHGKTLEQTMRGQRTINYVIKHLKEYSDKNITVSGDDIDAYNFFLFKVMWRQDEEFIRNNMYRDFH